MDEYQIKEIERKAKLKEKVQNATKELIDALNIMGREEEVLDAFTEAVETSHRTLQANLVRTIQGFLKRYAENNYFDARNEGAVNFAKAVTEATKNNHIPFI